MGRKSKRASDGSQTVCDQCKKPVRGEKGLIAHKKVCAVAAKQKD